MEGVRKGGRGTAHPGIDQRRGGLYQDMGELIRDSMVKDMGECSSVQSNNLAATMQVKRAALG